MNELPEIGSMLYTCVQRVLGSPGGKHCKCDVQKNDFGERLMLLFDSVLSEIDLGNVDTWQV